MFPQTKASITVSVGNVISVPTDYLGFNQLMLFVNYIGSLRMVGCVCRPQVPCLCGMCTSDTDGNIDAVLTDHM